MKIARRKFLLLSLTVVLFQTTAAHPAAQRIVRLAIANRSVAPPSRTLRVKRGDNIRIEIEADERVELHLHGYDLKTVAEPAKPGFFELTATAAGRFPVTSHGFSGAHGGGHHKALFYLEIHPE